MALLLDSLNAVEWLCFCACFAMCGSARTLRFLFLWTWAVAFRCSCRLWSAHTGPIRVMRVMERVFGRFCGIVVFTLSISAYVIASFDRYLKAADDRIDDILAIRVAVLSCLFALFVTLLVVVFAVPVLALLVCVLQVTRLMLTVFLIPSCIMRATPGPIVTSTYGSNWRGWSFE